MSIMRPLTAAALAATIATPAVADRVETIYLNPFAGYQLFDDKRDLSETGTFGIGAEYRFLPNWAIEAVYSRADADRKYRPGSSDFDEFRVDGTYYFAGPDEAWNPYVSLGAGHADFGDDVLAVQTAGSDHEETRVNVGAGVRYNVSDRVSIRGDLREFHGIDESTFDTMASLGVSFAFSRTVSDPEPPKPADADGDGVADSRDQCPGTPAGATVDSTGCERDSDNDGVADSRDNCPTTPNPDQADIDGDGKGDACDSVNDLDDDGDGIEDSADNCPAVPNADQEDGDGDGVGDSCDSTFNDDTDGDGIVNERDYGILQSDYAPLVPFTN